MKDNLGFFHFYKKESQGKSEKKKKKMKIRRIKLNF